MDKEEKKNIYSEIEDNNLICNYLPKDMLEGELKMLFDYYGKVEAVRIIRTKDTLESKGYGFVKMSSREEALKAIENLTGFEIRDKALKVSFARKSTSEIKQTNLYVQNLPKSYGKEDLEKLFSPYGKIIECKVLTDHKTQEKKGVGFVRFEYRMQADHALRAMNGYVPPGYSTPVRVKIAEDFITKTERRLLKPPVPAGNLSYGGRYSPYIVNYKPHPPIHQQQLYGNDYDQFCQSSSIPFGQPPTLPEIPPLSQAVGQPTLAPGYPQGPPGLSFAQSAPPPVAPSFAHQNMGMGMGHATHRGANVMVDLAQVPASVMQPQSAGPIAPLYVSSSLNQTPVAIMPPGAELDITQFVGHGHEHMMNPANGMNPSQVLEHPMNSHMANPAVQSFTTTPASYNNQQALNNVPTSGPPALWCLFVYNLQPDTNEKALYDLFCPYGQITSLKVIRNENQQCKGYGFVNYDTCAQAMLAIQYLNGYRFRDKILQVKFKQAKV